MADATSDVIAIDPTAAYENGDFVITGHASSPFGVGSVSLRGFGTSGTVPLGTTAVDANGDFTFDLPIRGTSYSSIFATEIDNNGGAKQVNTELYLDGHWYGKPYVATEDQFTSYGARKETLYFRADGSVQGEVLYDYNNINDSVALRRVNNADGTSTTTVTESGATVQAAVFDTITNGSEPGNTFVFDPGDGLDVVKQFRGNGTDHDTLSLKGSDFDNSIAEVLANTHQYRGVGTYIVDPSTGDAVRLTNVSKAELVANKSDIAFHG